MIDEKLYERRIAWVDMYGLLAIYWDDMRGRCNGDIYHSYRRCTAKTTHRLERGWTVSLATGQLSVTPDGG